MAPARSASPSIDRSEDDDHGGVDLDAFRVPPPRWWDRLGLTDQIPLSPARLVAAAVALAMVVGAGWWLLRPPAPPLEASLPRATEAGAGSDADGAGGPGATPGPEAAASPSSTAVATELVVQAAGAVVRPGVYRIPSGGRVDDLVRAAGGLTPEADGDRVNLAAPLADGQRIWVPRQGEEEVPEVVVGADGGGGGGTGSGEPGGGAEGGAAAGEPIDLNTADAAALDTLPGVGPSTAQAILSYRDEHGPFSSVDELLEVRGIGEAKLEQLRPLVRVG